MKHSNYGGSKAEIYMSCPASIKLSEGFSNTTSSFALEGTEAHEIAAFCLKNEIYEIEDEQDISVYLNYIKAIKDKHPNHICLIENSFHLDFIENEDIFGTNDALFYIPSLEKLIIIDFKFGRGKSVAVENNAQLQFYALGAINNNPDWIIKQVELVIVAPRCFNAPHVGAIKSSVIYPDDLINFGELLINAIVESKSKNPRIVAGNHCTWCKYKPQCAVYNLWAAQKPKRVRKSSPKGKLTPKYQNNLDVRMVEKRIR